MKITFFEVNHFGDFVCAMPVIDGLRRMLPQANIKLVTTEFGEQLIRHTNLVDEICVVPFGKFKGMARTPLRLLLWMYREGLFGVDASVSGVHECSTSPLVAALGGSRIRVGHVSAAKGSMLYTDMLHFDMSKHITENGYASLSRLANRLEIAGPMPQMRRQQIIFTDEEQREFERKFSKIIDMPFVIIQPFSKFSHKEWPIEKFTQLAQKIEVRLPGCRTLVVTDKRPFPELEKCLNLNSTSLRELAWLISKSMALVGNNSGPMNLSNLMGIPTVCINGASPTYWHPYDFGEGTTLTIASSLWCAPCENETIHQKCVRGLMRPECMDVIQVDEVINGLCRVIKGP